MQKVLVLSYFYYPCNLTASQRTHAWAQYLRDYGYYPIVVTRNWDVPVQNPADAQRSSGDEIRHEVFDTHEVYYLPYRANLRDHLFVRLQGTKFAFLSKILTFWELLLQNFVIGVVPYRNIYSFLCDYITQHPDVQKLVVSANPYTPFHFAYRLQRRFGIRWIADYRDDWSTSDINNPLPIIKDLEARSERLWVATASRITSVSSYYTKKISCFVGVPGTVLLNGFVESEVENIGNVELAKDNFEITYTGTLYETQPIEILLTATKQLVDKEIARSGIAPRIRLNFPGLAYSPQQAKRVSDAMIGYENYIAITPRVPKAAIMSIQQQSHLLVSVTHSGTKGVLASKLFEYVGLRKRVLSFPSDGDCVDEILEDTQLGLIANDTHSCLTHLEFAYQHFIDGNNGWFRPEGRHVEHYSRRYSVSVLAETLDQI